MIDKNTSYNASKYIHTGKENKTQNQIESKHNYLITAKGVVQWWEGGNEQRKNSIRCEYHAM